MSKRNETRPRQTPIEAGREVSPTDGTVCTSDKKNVGTIVGTQLLAGTEVRIVKCRGKLYIPEVDVAEGLDQNRNSFKQLLKRNSELLENYPLDVMVTTGVAMRPVSLLSFENTRRAIMMVDHNVKDPLRREFLIQRKRQYFKIIDDYHNQTSLQVSSPEAWQEERKKAATNWNHLRRALKEKVVPTIRDPSHERFVYINEAKMLNKNVYGRHERAIRDKSTLQQIEALEVAESWDTALVHMGILDKTKRDALIDDMLIRHYPDLDLERTLPEPVRLQISAPPGQRILIEFIGEASA